MTSLTDIMNEIILKPSVGKEVKLKMAPSKSPHSTEEVLKVRKNVFEDVEYEIELVSENNLLNVCTFINGEEVESHLHESKIVFGYDSQKIFSNIFGFAQIALCVKGHNTEKWYYSEYVSVLVRPSNKNRSISLMLHYIYENMEDYLYQEMTRHGIGKDEVAKDFWSQILLLEEIVNVYESNYGYFMANSRYKLDKKEVLDRTEKLQYVDSKTIQYIVRHPEYLDRSAVGISYGSQTYLPRKTLMSQNVITYDIYENQVVVGFLSQMFMTIENLKTNVQKFIDSVVIKETAENGYIVSSFIIYKNATEQLQDFMQRIELLEEKFRQLLMSYKTILKVTYSNVYIIPKPTAIFMNVPQYNRVYSCIMKWHKRNAYDFKKEQIMMNFFSTPEIFETYSLIKLVGFIKESGYELTETKHVYYPKRADWRYEQRNCNNTYVFKNEDSSITLYYEPIIYDEDSRTINGIGLYRNNSISLNNETDEERRGHYYVPDYLIKYSDGEKESYLICDAKFSSNKNVRYKMIPNLAYKYITSISTIRLEDKLKGLYVFYGIVDDNVNQESFYDVHIDTAKEVTPYIKMVPVSEEVPYAYQEANAYDMLRKLIG